MARRRNASGTGRETVSLSVSISSDTNEKILQELSENRQYGSKSDFLEQGAEILLTGKVCPYCNMTTYGKEIKYCTSCGRDMSFSPEEKEEARAIFEKLHPEYISNDKQIVRYHLSNRDIKRLLDGEQIDAVPSRVYSRDEYLKDMEDRRKKIKELMKERHSHSN